VALSNRAMQTQEPLAESEPPTKIVLAGQGPGLPRLLVCNVMVGSPVLPSLSGTHPTAA
jgi:hypothetical protein